jgi:phosphoribosyl-ATP pyrophosphohydrolase
MIIPSIDLMGGNAVQLIGGKEKALDAGDPLPIAERFSLAGDIAVIDLDAAMNTGINNEATIENLIRRFPCRVGGGIRDVGTAVKWLDAGAERIILGTKAVPEILQELPKERVHAALDAVHGEVVVEGWKTKTGRGIAERMQELRPYVAGFLVTFVEREGRLQGLDFGDVRDVVEAAGPCELTIAGGVTTVDDIAELDALGADAQVGMALYTNKMNLGEAVAAPLKSDRPDELIPTVVTDEHGVALGLCYSSKDSVILAINERRGIYHSRRRGIWRKGETSGALQELLSVRADCDRDSLRFVVRQAPPGFCHLNTHTCWGEDRALGHLERVINSRMANAPQGSYTKRLFEEDGLLDKKIGEEARELIEAHCPDNVRWEAADLLYFTLVRMAKAGVSLAAVEQELNLRAKKVTRRPGNAK